jgi:hypothetical protein
MATVYDMWSDDDCGRRRGVVAVARRARGTKALDVDTDERGLMVAVVPEESPANACVVEGRAAATSNAATVVPINFICFLQNGRRGALQM